MMTSWYLQPVLVRHIINLFGREFCQQAAGLRGSAECCSVDDDVLYLVPAIYSSCESEPQAQIFFSNAAVSTKIHSGAGGFRQSACIHSIFSLLQNKSCEGSWIAEISAQKF